MRELLSSSSDSDIAIATSREYAKHYCVESKIYCFHKSENIYVYPVAALVHESFDLMDPINHQIQRIVETGLINKWKDDIRIRLTRRANNANNQVVPFTIHNITGGIVELTIGLSLACLAFLLELYFAAKRRSCRISQPSMWRVCECIFVTEERNAWSEIGRYLRWKLQNKNE